MVSSPRPAWALFVILCLLHRVARTFFQSAPIILDKTHWQWWIDDRRNGAAVKFMLRPFEAGDMACYRVSPLVNNAKNDLPECLTPA